MDDDADWETETVAAIGRRVVPDGAAVWVPLVLMDGAKSAADPRDAARAEMEHYLSNAWKAGPSGDGR